MERNREDDAFEVMAVLVDANQERVKFEDIVTRTGLRPHHVTQGIQYLRENLAGEKDVMVVSALGRDGGYAIVGDETEVRRYASERVRWAKTNMSRMMSGAVNQLHVAAGSTSDQDIDDLQLGFTRLMEDMERILNRI